MELIADGAFFGIGFEEGGKRVITVGSTVDKATWLPNLQPSGPFPFGATIATTASTVTVAYERPAPGAGVALQKGIHVVTVKDGKISSYLDYVDITDPGGLQYLTYVLGGKDPRTVPEVAVPR